MFARALSLAPLRSLARKPSTAQARGMAGHMFKKNIFVEENAGLREKSYTTWEFDEGAAFRIIAMTVVPVVIYLAVLSSELETNDKQVGRSIRYGIAPPLDK